MQPINVNSLSYSFIFTVLLFFALTLSILTLFATTKEKKRERGLVTILDYMYSRFDPLCVIIHS